MFTFIVINGFYSGAKQLHNYHGLFIVEQCFSHLYFLSKTELLFRASNKGEHLLGRQVVKELIYVH
jgi:hypothetical protein